MHPSRCGKGPFASKAKAKQRAALVGRQYGLRLYVYECACGMWHMTKQDPATYRARQRERDAVLSEAAGDPGDPGKDLP